MTTQITEAPPSIALPPGGIPNVTDIDQKLVEAIVKGVQENAKSDFADIVKENLGDPRSELVAQNHDRLMNAVLARSAHGEADAGKHIVGHFFQAACETGQMAKNLKIGADKSAEVISEKLEKRLGYDVSRELSVSDKVSKTVNVADAAQGGLHIQGTVLERWYDVLRAESVVLGLRPEIVPVTGGFLEVGVDETDPTLTWAGEINTQDLTSTPTSSMRKAEMRKAMAEVLVSNEYMESADPAVLNRLETRMRNAFRVGFDEKYLFGDGLENTVRGLTSHITATSASAGKALADVYADFQTMMVSVRSSNVLAERLALIFHDRTWGWLMFGAVDADGRTVFQEEMSRGTLFGMPYRTTTTVPINIDVGGGDGAVSSIILMQAMNQFIIGQGTGLGIRWYENMGAATVAGVLRSTVEADVQVLVGRDTTATIMPRPTSGYNLSDVQYAPLLTP